MIVRHLLVKLSFSGNANKLLKFDKHVDSLRSNVLRLSAAFGLATVALGYFIKEAAKLEQTRIAFQVMTNSIEVGDRLLKDLYKFARTTPFQIPGVLSATRTLLAMGIESNNMVDTLTQIGEVSAGLNVRLDVLANIFGKVRSVGHLTGFEMERLRRAGVPLSEFLAKTLGTDIPGMLTMIRKKQIDFAQFQEAWAAMVEDRFNGLMDKLLGTLLGMLSNVKDFIFEIVTYSGETLLPAMKLWTKQLADVLENSKDLIELNLKIFFTDLSKVIINLNKHFMRFVSSSKESIMHFGGMKKALTALGIVLGIYFGGTTLKILAWLFKSSINFLSIGNIKLMLFAGSMLVILGVLYDIFETLTTNKRTVTRDFLTMLEKDYPNAFQTIIKWIRILKKEIEGMSLMMIGILTLDKDMIAAGAEQVSEAYKMMFKKEPKEPSGPFGPIQQKVASRLPIYKGPEEFGGPIPSYPPRTKTLVEEVITGGIARKVGVPLIKWMQDLGRSYDLPIGPTEWAGATVAKMPGYNPLKLDMLRNVQRTNNRAVNNIFNTNIKAVRLPADADTNDFRDSIHKSMKRAYEKHSEEERRKAYYNISSPEISGKKED